MLSPAAAKQRRRQQAGAGGGMGLARTGHKTNRNNLDVWRARVPARSLLGSLLHLRLPLGFGLQVPALPFLEATLLVLCLRLRTQRECKAAVSVCCECVQQGNEPPLTEVWGKSCPLSNTHDSQCAPALSSKLPHQILTNTPSQEHHISKALTGSGEEAGMGTPWGAAIKHVGASIALQGPLSGNEHSLSSTRKRIYPTSTMAIFKRNKNKTKKKPQM